MHKINYNDDDIWIKVCNEHTKQTKDNSGIKYAN